MARPARRIVLSETTYDGLSSPVEAEALASVPIRGREATVRAYMIELAKEGG